MNLNKFVALTVCSLGLAVLSCKHETPGNPAPEGSGSTGGGGTIPPSSCSPDTVYFQQQVLPIFISNCSMSGCHDNTSHQDGVVLTSYQTIMTTGEIEPGDPDDSEVYEKITDHDPSDRMPPPPRNALTTAQIETIRKWIRQGAKNNSCETSVCDTANVTYSNTIRPVIANKCGGCHGSSGPSGGLDLSKYTVLHSKATDGRLWGSVNHFPGFSAMPKNGNKLSTCELAQIRKWIDAGAPNN